MSYVCMGVLEVVVLMPEDFEVVVGVGGAGIIRFCCCCQLR